jgi:hypothetical protein
MGAVAGKGPAVMEGPDQLCPVPAEISEEGLQVTVMTVDVVKVHDIGAEPFQFRDDPPGSLPGVEAIIAQHLRFECLEPDISALSTGNPQGIPIGPAAKDMVFHISFGQDPADSNTDFAGAADAAGGIDLNDFHPTFSQKKWYGNTRRLPPRLALIKK